MEAIILAGKKHNIVPMWKVLNKEVDLGQTTSFFDHVYLGCTQTKSDISKDSVDNNRTMFDSRISAGGTQKKKNDHVRKIFATIWKVMRRIVWSDNVVGKQDDATTLQSIYSLHR